MAKSLDPGRSGVDLTYRDFSVGFGLPDASV